MDQDTSEIAAVAARLVVQEGLAYGPAKRNAVKQLGLPTRSSLPDNQQLEDAVAAYIADYCSQTQPGELLALRRLALHWMEKMAEFCPYLARAVWHGTATRSSDIYIDLFCHDSKSAELFLINNQVRYLSRSVPGFRGEAVDALSVHVFCPEFNEEIGVHLLIYQYDDIRGALRPDAQGRSPRANLAAVRRLLQV